MRLNHKKQQRNGEARAKTEGDETGNGAGSRTKKKRVRKGSKCVEGRRERGMEGEREGVSNKGGERVQRKD